MEHAASGFSAGFPVPGPSILNRGAPGPAALAAEIQADFVGLISELWVGAATGSGDSGIRGSKKTNRMHRTVVDALRKSFGDEAALFDDAFDAVSEGSAASGGKRVSLHDISGRNFNVDALMLRKAGRPGGSAAFLMKAPLSSINKNAHNYLEGRLGQIARFYCPQNLGDELVFVSLVPRVAPCGEFRSARKLAFEAVRHISLHQSTGRSTRSLLDDAPFLPEVKRLVREICVFYDLPQDALAAASGPEFVAALASTDFRVREVDLGQFFEYRSTLSARLSEAARLSA